MLRYKDMTRKFINLAHRAASHPGCTLLVNNTLDKLSKQVEEYLNGFTSSEVPISIPTNVTPHTDVVSTAKLKKKWWKQKPPNARESGLTRNAK